MWLFNWPLVDWLLSGSGDNKPIFKQYIWLSFFLSSVIILFIENRWTFLDWFGSLLLLIRIWTNENSDQLDCRSLWHCKQYFTNTLLHLLRPSPLFLVIIYLFLFITSIIILREINIDISVDYRRYIKISLEWCP